MNKSLFFRETWHLLDEELLDRISSAAVERTYRARESILTVGQKPTAVRVLVDGVIRVYCMDEEGKEITDMFLSRPGMCSASVVFGDSGIFGEKALTDVSVLELPFDDAMELLADYSEMQRVWYAQIRDYTARYMKLRKVCTCMQLSERIDWFRREDPAAYAAANNAQLAGFFGVSRESVSRAIKNAASRAAGGFIPPAGGNG